VKIRFRDLSTPLKWVVVLSWIMAGAWAYAFIVQWTARIAGVGI
jgi:hypothetical protein